MASVGLLVLRVALAVVFVAHGSNILFGAWGGPGIGAGGITETANYYASLGLAQPTLLAIAAGLVQLIGGVLLGIGFLTRAAAVALIAYLAVGIWKEHLKWGLFLNWRFAADQHHGIEYSLVLTAALVMFFFAGAGGLSIDGTRAKSKESRAAGRARLRGKV